MYTFDLKWVLLALLLLMGALVLATIGAMRWWWRRQRSMAALDTLQTVLVNAPVAVVALDQQGPITIRIQRHSAYWRWRQHSAPYP